MNWLCCFIALLPIQPHVAPVPPVTPLLSAQGPKADTSYHIKYDHSALRIPGRAFAIGLVIPAVGRTAADTIGWPGDKNGWSKYRIVVDSGSFSGGKVRLDRSNGYKKHDSVTVTVFTRKWLLGGKGKWLATRRIPYNYEDSIAVLTSGNTAKSPGDHLQFGVRTIYDNKQFTDQWFPAKKKNRNDFSVSFEGGHLSKSKGDLKIDTDPARFVNHRVRLIARLARDTAISDTLQFLLDYTAQYQCRIRSATGGHNLDVAADAYYDSLLHTTLLKIDVLDSTGKKTYHYLVNTNGGSLVLSSKGADGLDGRNGFDGTPGSPGSAGLVSVGVQTTTADDGSTQTTTTTTQGPGGDGSNGANGEDGAEGGNGYDGGNIVIHYTKAAASFLEKITAQSQPGNAGSGGRGGTGGSGGIGGNGNPSGNNGIRGNDGRNGFDGVAGKAGKVSFAEDHPFPPYSKTLLK
ncbi:MAG TPA: hypothetical protein VK563_05280 [Puia sp.]|nr:hypothetical protein [Puia sp.]